MLLHFGKLYYDAVWWEVACLTDSKKKQKTDELLVHVPGRSHIKSKSMSYFCTTLNR